MRPTLHPNLPPQTFAAWYWLKTELQTYCRAQGLPLGGSKAELMQRVSAHLSVGPALPAAVATPSPRRSGMPLTLHVHTVIEPGWALGHALRRFFTQHVGASFRFNQALRDLFQNPQGQTLGDALALYTQTRTQPAPIGAQFQFNQHMRDYFAQHPHATREDALLAWRHKRQSANSLCFFTPQP